jgi:tetratricopeptide (TPR) repeat protein
MDATSLHEYRRLLRFATLPFALRDSVVIGALVGVDQSALRAMSDVDLVSAFRAALNRALDTVTPRQRDIVRRRDLQGESCDHVARELGLSKRQVIREHNAALVTIATLPQGSQPLVSVSLVSDRNLYLEAQLAMSHFLEQTGSQPEAADMLQALSANAPDAASRLGIELQLSEMYTRAGRLSLAERHVEHARRLAMDAGDREIRTAEIDAAAARLSVASGDAKMGATLARRSSLSLSSWTDSNDDARATRALVSVLNLRTELAFGAGDLGKAIGINKRTLRVLNRLGSVDSDAAIEATMWKAMLIGILDGDAQLAKDQLAQCYARATRLGLLRDAVSFAGALAATHRRFGQPAEALHLLGPLRSTARRVCLGEELGGFFLELAGASLEMGLGDDATAYLSEARLSTALPWIQGCAALFESQLHLSRKRFTDALAAAETAETTFVRVGRERLVGPALRLQAEALVALGQVDRAKRVMDVAIDALNNAGSLSAVRAACDSMFALTGDRRFKVRTNRVGPRTIGRALKNP